MFDSRIEDSVFAAMLPGAELADVTLGVVTLPMPSWSMRVWKTVICWIRFGRPIYSVFALPAAILNGSISLEADCTNADSRDAGLLDELDAILEGAQFDLAFTPNPGTE